MNVYVVMQGENYEGGSIVEIFSTQSEAVKFATKFAKTMSFPMIKHKDRNVWNGGCDWLSISAYTLSYSAEESLQEMSN